MAPEDNNAQRATDRERVKSWQQERHATDRERVKRAQHEQQRKDCDPVKSGQHEQRRKDRERVKRWQHERQAQGFCRCGARIVAESRSRCWECLERCRRNQAARRGRPVRGRRRRGRPMLGSLSVRRRAFEHEERLRGLRRQRQIEQERKRRIWRYP